MLRGWKDERRRRETAQECQSDGGCARLVGMKGCEEYVVLGIGNERGSEKKKMVREEERGGGARRGDRVIYKQG